jgi:hypothetical protein
MKCNVSAVVIDADVARAAGLSEKPVSSNARQLMDGMLKSKMKIVLNPALRSEWDKHASNFSTKWLASMVAKRQFVYVKNAPELMRAAIDAAPLAEKDQVIAKKDAHLVDLALASERFIASNDVAARTVFCALAKHTTLLNEVVWAVPTESAVEMVALFAERGYVPLQWLLLHSNSP